MTSNDAAQGSSIKKEISVASASHVNVTPVQITYNDGMLCVDSAKLQTNDIITVLELPGQDGTTAYTILSIALCPASQDFPYELQITRATALPSSFLSDVPSCQLPGHLRTQSSDNILHVLISTLSGTGLAPEFWKSVLHPLLSEVGWKDSSYNVVKTSSAISVKEFAGGSLRAGAEKGLKQTVLMLSGDGGIVDTLNGLLEQSEKPSKWMNPVVVQIPLGTGNALFHSLHKSSKVASAYVQSLRTLFHGTAKPLPTFKASFSPGACLLTNEGQTATQLNGGVLYGAVVASYGLHATLVADSDTIEYRKHGNTRFELVAKDLLFPTDGSAPHAYQARVVLDRKEIERKEHGYVLATLVSNLENTFTISPASKPLDGKLKVVHFAASGGIETMEIMKAAYNCGKHTEMKEVGYEDVTKMRIEVYENGLEFKWRRFCIDGLIVRVEEGGWMEVEMVEGGHETISIVVDTD